MKDVRFMFVDGGSTDEHWTFEGPVSGNSVPERKGKADEQGSGRKQWRCTFFSCTATVKFQLQH